MADAPRSPHVCLVGGGIASLAAAAFLVRDADLPGEHIHILEELPVAGGSMDGSGEPAGYVTRGGRMLEEEACTCLWNLLETIPTLADKSVSVREGITEFHVEWPTAAKARLIGRGTTVLDAADQGLDMLDRLEPTRLLVLPESVIGARRIEDFSLPPHFFATKFWTMWRTTFALQNRHNAIELRRYPLRFTQEFPRMHTLAGVRRTRLNQFDSIIRPLLTWLEARGVVFEYGVRNACTSNATGTRTRTNSPPRPRRPPSGRCCREGRSWWTRPAPRGSGGSAGAPHHDRLTLTGGTIGRGLPLAAGAAIACPDRPALCLEADGSAMDTVSALWTHAREGLDITPVRF